MRSDIFYIDVTPGKEVEKYMFYYNFRKAALSGVNEHVKEIIGESNSYRLAMTGAYMNAILASDASRSKDDDYANMGLFNKNTGEVEMVDFRKYMLGITADVNSVIAKEILKRANYYCPVDTGALRDSGHIEYNDDGTCRIVYDCPYAWYVDTFTWKDHTYPTCAKFLERAIEEVSEEYKSLIKGGVR
jgi:hypothetical protein